MGVQANGSQLLDGAAGQEFQGPGEIGMLDWAAFTISGPPNATGTAALFADASRSGFAMARTLGGGSNQVAEAGRRVVVA